MNQEVPNVQAGFRKGRGTRDQISNICWIIEKSREFQKTSTSASLTILKPLTVWITTNRNILKEMRIPDHLICLLRNLYADQEAYKAKPFLLIFMEMTLLFVASGDFRNQESYSSLKCPTCGQE